MSEHKGVITSIDQKLFGLSNSFDKQRIFRVHHKLRSQNEVAYEPQMFSIGPYHHGKENLVKAQTYKLWYLKELLLRRGESSTERYINALKALEEGARSWYAEEDMIGLGSDEFVEMMLLDGFFIIELLRKYAGWRRYKEYPVNYCPKQGEKPVPLPNPTTNIAGNVGDVVHLLHLVHECWCWSFAGKLAGGNRSPDNGDPQGLRSTRGGWLELMKESSIKLHKIAGNACWPFAAKPAADNRSLENGHPHDIYSTSDWDLEKSVSATQLPKITSSLHCFSFAAKRVADHQSQENGDSQDNCSTSGEVYEHIKCASELQQAGIKFETANKSVSWLDIAFEKGVMKIPTLDVHDVTECVFRNLIGFELYMINGLYDRRYVIDYLTFMDSLIDSSRDVEKLRHQKIITKWLGDDKAISSVFNSLVKEVETEAANDFFCYSRVFKQVNEYSSRRWNIWRAHLMRNYFNNPWSIISFAAALVLLILTFVQTIFSILQFKSEPSCGCKVS
ncbi:UPF0481 protein At3g47200-like [Coffea eugenioides]|uniref:UPF0481 protein At3g47200-like n=1 Tax=Coffea eugenioides TaxID=49369 RepID=UPI000F614C36|nr:UPF0481 protein At3g47200-like [Coffea eugenioides]XP_027183375.1 UPF0481 protein At3g47200-like [Coffea eugenioides]